MAAYIDREATIESLNALKPFLRDRGQVQLLRRVMNHIGKIPAADVVPVVRCKSCIHAKWSEQNKAYYCRRRWAMHKVRERDFCSYGKRKEADGK